MALIIFEGLSGAGKTTLFTPVHRARSYKDLHIHRFTATHYVYAIQNKRDVDLNELQDMEMALQKTMPTVLVWCRPAPSVAARRTVEKRDTNVKEIDFVVADGQFKKYLSRLTEFDHILELDTGKLSVEECVALIVAKVEEVEREESR
jgi:thymidylate kinase